MSSGAPAHPTFKESAGMKTDKESKESNDGFVCVRCLVRLPEVPDLHCTCGSVTFVSYKNPPAKFRVGVNVTGQAESLQSARRFH